MKENLLFSRLLKSFGSGRAILATGLILVTVVGLFEQYEVQEVLFPENYHETELTLIREECVKIDNNLRSLRMKLDNLKALSGTIGPLSPHSPGSPSSGSSASISAPEVPFKLAPAWQEALHLAKKERVSGTRKLKSIDAVLNSMERSMMKPLLPNNNKNGLSKFLNSILNSMQLTENPFSPDYDKNVRARILAQVHDVRAHCRIYQSGLTELSVKLDKLAGYNDSQ